MYRTYCTYVDSDGDNNTATFKGRTSEESENEMERFIVEGNYRRQNYTTIKYMQRFEELRQEIDKRLDNNHRILPADMPYYRLCCFQDIDSGEVFGVKQTDLNRWDRQSPGALSYMQYLRSPEGRGRLAGMVQSTPQIKIRNIDQPNLEVRVVRHPYHHCWVLQTGAHAIDVLDVLKWVKANHPEWWHQD